MTHGHATTGDVPSPSARHTRERTHHHRPGRPARGAAMAGDIPCGPLAQKRLYALLATLTQEMTVEEARGVLGVSRARMHELRREWLTASAAALEPRPRGRVPRRPSVDEREIRRLTDENDALRHELRLARERADLVAALGRTVRVPPSRLGKR